MTVDVASLESLSSYEDPEAGIRESFLSLEVGGAATIAVLSEPLENPLPLGWVLCHSFGLEQIYLQTIETPIARRMSAAGFSVLRFHVQGYGDSVLPVEQVSFQSHVRDTIDAVKAFVAATGISQVGLMGARFGGAVAVRAADDVEARAVALWQPVVSGHSYLRSLMRRSAMSDLASTSSGRTVTRPEEQEKSLDDSGFVDLQGFPLTRDAFEALESMDLITDLKSFSGSSLIVQISSSEQVDPDLEQLAARLRDLGGACRFEVATHSRARGFGMPRFRAAGDTKVDTQGDILEDLVRHTVEWGRALPQVRSGTTSGEQR